MTELALYLRGLLYKALARVSSYLVLLFGGSFCIIINMQGGSAQGLRVLIVK